MYPPPSIYTCTARIWLREIGFSLTYGALMLKTWRWVIYYVFWFDYYYYYDSENSCRNECTGAPLPTTMYQIVQIYTAPCCAMHNIKHCSWESHISNHRKYFLHAQALLHIIFFFLPSLYVFSTEIDINYRISVIFHVRSAKAVKITDAALLKRLGIICGCIGIGLLVRTIVAPPLVIVGRTADDLKAYLCKTDWWDHTFTSSK